MAGASGCKRSDETSNRQAEANAIAPSENLAATVPLPQPPMDRGALLHAVALARSAAAAGTDDRQAQQALDGKEFALRIRFGCAGATAKEANPPTLSWTFDSKSGVLRVRAAPDLSSVKDLALPADLGDIEAVEGFWLARPWLLTATCPAKPAGASNAATADDTEAPSQPAVAKVGIAQFFTSTDPRTARRDHRPYQAVQKRDPAAPIGTQGFDLVLSGRLRALADGRVIRCTATGPDSPPACMISARFDHVWIDDAATSERIADWSSS